MRRADLSVRKRPLALLALCLLLAAPFAGATGCTHRVWVIDTEGNRMPRPRNLRQAILTLDRMLDAPTRERLRVGPDDRDLRRALGFSVRGAFGLWNGSALYRWFRRRGVDHPEHISPIIVRRYIRYVRGEPLDVAAKYALTRILPIVDGRVDAPVVFFDGKFQFAEPSAPGDGSFVLADRDAGACVLEPVSANAWRARCPAASAASPAPTRSAG